jgi:beta-lactam-binding protein with PASTA domain
MIGAILAGRFELTGLLAESPIFAVYSARDRLTSRDVSLRMIKPPFDREPGFKAALKKAVERNASIQSPNVERLYELYDESEGNEAYIVGDLTRAPSLADRIRKLAPFTSPVAVAAAIGITGGLDAFHKANVVHGDVGSENVAMMADGDTRLQMGAIWEAYAASQTAGSVVLPALAPYLAPEVSSGGMPSKKSDVYSVGILLYELLAGRKPYVADTAIATAMRHSSEPTPRVRSISPTVPTVLDEIVYKAMAKDPEQRYSNAGEMFSDLRQVQDAMRFGRTLAWPLKGQAAAVPSAARPTVAPRMSAIREQPPSPRDREVRDSDVPIWMWVLLALGVGFGICLVGFYLFTNIERPRLVNVPNLKGLSISEGRETLTRLGLELRVGKALPSESYEADRILDSSPGPGDKVAEKAPVTVTVSSGSREVEVPQLKGLTPDKARSVLATQNLSMDDNMDHVFDAALPQGTISRQDPPAGAKTDRDRKIHVAVNSQSGATPPSEGAPEVQSYVYSPSVYLSDITQPVDVRIDVTDDQGTRTFYDEVKSPGDHIDTSVVAHGSRATFQIYYDGRLVKTVTKNATEETP